jgi:hypothetical protein
MRLRIRNAALAAVALAGVAAQAQIPSTAPYVTDLQNVYVQDDTSQGIGNLNMVLCVIGALDPGDMVNAGAYIALVDMNKCNNKGGGSNSSATGATNYATAVVNVTRASNSDPMVGKVWMSLTEQGSTTNVYAYLSATQSPDAAPPYGVFRMDYIGKKNGQAGFNGYVNSQPGSISFLETGANSSNTALAMSASSTTSGQGTMNIAGGSGGGTGSATFNFAYNSGYFRRSDGTVDECFDRSKANAAVSVWQYGTYNANDGSRVDQAHPGFPIVAVSAGTTYYGYANYWGINFQGLDLNSIADASPIAGLTVTDQRPGNTTAYNLSKVGGKLTKWTQAATTLAALDGIPFSFGADLTGQTSNTTAVSGWNNWIAQWNSANQTITVTGVQNCGSNGCVPSALAGNVTATINTAFLAANPIMGWSDSFGGNLNIPATGSAHLATDAVYYFTQSTVIPGSSGAPTALYCLSQCPTAASLTAFSAGSQSSPFGNSTDQQWFSAPSANTVSYTFSSTGLMESGSSMVLEQPFQYPSGSMYAQGGYGIWHHELSDRDGVRAVQSGRLLHVADRTEPVEPVAVADQGERQQRRPARCAAERAVHGSDRNRLRIICRQVDPAAVQRVRQPVWRARLLRGPGNQCHGGLQYGQFALRADVFAGGRHHDDAACDFEHGCDAADRQGARRGTATERPGPEHAVFSLRVDDADHDDAAVGRSARPDQLGGQRIPGCDAHGDRCPQSDRRRSAVVGRSPAPREKARFAALFLFPPQGNPLHCVRNWLTDFGSIVRMASNSPCFWLNTTRPSPSRTASAGTPFFKGTP